MIKDDCIFCKLANGVFPTSTVYEDNDFKAILDISPSAKGHTLVIPKDHMADLLEADEETLGKALKVVQKVAKAVKESMGADGVNILQNNGTAAGQSVFHLHFHIIPRYDNDSLNLTWEQLSYAEGEADELAAKIGSYVK